MVLKLFDIQYHHDEGNPIIVAGVETREEFVPTSSSSYGSLESKVRHWEYIYIYIYIYI